MSNLARAEKIAIVILLACAAVVAAQDKATPTCAELPKLHVTIISSDGDKLFDGNLPQPTREINLNFPSGKIRICSEIVP